MQQNNDQKPDFSNVTGGIKNPELAGATPSQPETKTYTVQKGDSLSKIAKQFYGDANEWRKIFEANKDTIKDPDLIHPGQELTIPQ